MLSACCEAGAILKAAVLKWDKIALSLEPLLRWKNKVINKIHKLHCILTDVKCCGERAGKVDRDSRKCCNFIWDGVVDPEILSTHPTSRKEGGQQAFSSVHLFQSLPLLQRATTLSPPWGSLNSVTKWDRSIKAGPLQPAQDTLMSNTSPRTLSQVGWGFARPALQLTSSAYSCYSSLHSYGSLISTLCANFCLSICFWECNLRQVVREGCRKKVTF